MAVSDKDIKSFIAIVFFALSILIFVIDLIGILIALSLIFSEER